jgi:hypothetical protein
MCFVSECVFKCRSDIVVVWREKNERERETIFKKKKINIDER